MFLDANLTFTGANVGGSTAVTSSTVGSLGVLDMATGLVVNSGVVTTYAAAGLNIGNATYFSQSLGDGTNPLEAMASVGTALTGGTSLAIAMQGAVDASSGSYPANYSSLTWVTLETGPAIPAANLTAGALIPGPMIGTSPPGPFKCGSTTCSVKAVATPASNALPPFSRVAIPTAVAIQS